MSCTQSGTCAGASGTLVSSGQRRRVAADDQDLLRLDAMQPASDRHLRQGDVQPRFSLTQVPYGLLLFKRMPSFQSSLSLWSRLSILLNFLPPEADVTKTGAHKYLPYMYIQYVYSTMVYIPIVIRIFCCRPLQLGKPHAASSRRQAVTSSTGKTCICAASRL